MVRGMVTMARRILRGAGVVAALALAGCAQPSFNPVDWFHTAEGGKIAEERPSPPNVNAPYPNLSTVPPRPPPVDAKLRARIAGGLVADRTNAQYAAGLNPLSPPGPASLPVAPAPLPTGDETSGATLQGAAGPPPRGPLGPPRGPLGPPQPALPNVAATAPRRAPTQAVQQASLAAPTDPKQAATRGSVDQPPPKATPAAALASLPAIPDQPPPPPVLDGVGGTTRPTPPPATPPPSPPPPVVAAAPGAPVLLAFAPGSATLPVAALAPLKVLTRSRGAASVSVTGYGDAAGSDAQAQAAALPLALARARAVAAQLLAEGVPSSSLRVGAEAQGHGAAARLIN